MPSRNNTLRALRQRMKWLSRTLISRRGRRLVGILLLSPFLLLLTLTALTPLPEELRQGHQFDASVRVLDRHGKLLAEVRADDGTRSRWAPIERIGKDVQLALMAAEDERFYWHPGVDPIAIVRALGQNFLSGRIVSGASTLTQQLGRTLVPRSRTLPGKLKEMVVALRIEASLSKDEVLEAYLNLVHFGPTLRGVESASHFYFDKPTSTLSLAEAATLAAMPKGPTLYDPRRNPDQLLARRNYILGRMQRVGSASKERAERAKRERLNVHADPTGWSAPHLVRGLLDGRVHPDVGPLSERVSEMRTTIDARLQREVQFAARTMVASLQKRKATAAAVVVLKNDTGEVLSWVGAHDFFDHRGQGQNDGVLAKRQPGSTLKPFVYGLAMEELDWTAATVLPDVELHLADTSGAYAPTNYDGRVHGPVRLREALANSYNIPAVYAASVVGPGRILERLQKLGMTTLDKESDHYGPAIALGDGEVRLIDLANAYATLARGGEHKPFKALIEAKNREGTNIALPSSSSHQVMPETVCRILSDVLADPNARLAAFGDDSVLELPFAAAAKTGTSKGFRDNLTVGFTPVATVAVWVGNFDGSPMEGVSGVTGAGPLFNAVMKSVDRYFNSESGSFEKIDERFEQVEICGLSGELPTPACTRRHQELFVRGTAPTRPCSMHTMVEVDTRNGLRAGPGCSREYVRTDIFEVYGARFNAWAQASRRPLAPTQWSPQCPGQGDLNDSGPRLAIRYPYPGAVFFQDPSMPDTMQGVVVRADAPAQVGQLTLMVDGRRHGIMGPPFERVLRLTSGRHEVWVEADERRSRPVAFEVR
ncbi:MAG: penicillin-binding protein 1C [Sorangium cellulosum]|nr:MAG: penicillin-binding protein 1C [Sorangium cellulosum]